MSEDKIRYAMCSNCQGEIILGEKFASVVMHRVEGNAIGSIRAVPVAEDPIVRLCESCVERMIVPWPKEEGALEKILFVDEDHDDEG